MFHDPSSWTSTELEIISISFASSPTRLESMARIRGSIPLRGEFSGSALLKGEHRKLAFPIPRHDNYGNILGLAISEELLEARIELDICVVFSEKPTGKL
jgi:hypothetical protein